MSWIFLHSTISRCAILVLYFDVIHFHSSPPFQYKAILRHSIFPHLVLLADDNKPMNIRENAYRPSVNFVSLMLAIEIVPGCH